MSNLVGAKMTILAAERPTIHLAVACKAEGSSTVKEDSMVREGNMVKAEEMTIIKAASVAESFFQDWLSQKTKSLLSVRIRS